MTVFLGGTCAGSKWRDELQAQLDAVKGHEVECFNPVVEDWNEECQAEERRQRAVSDYVLYVLTPAMAGVYSVAEVVDDSNKRPYKTLFSVIKEDESGTFSDKMLHSLLAVEDMLKANNATTLEFNAIAGFLIEQDVRRRESAIKRRNDLCSICTYGYCKTACTPDQKKKCRDKGITAGLDVCERCICGNCTTDSMDAWEEYCGGDDE